MATTLTAREIYTRGGDLRKTLMRGEVVNVTFHDKPWAQVVPHDLVPTLEAKNAELEAKVAELNAQLEAYRRDGGTMS